MNQLFSSFLTLQKNSISTLAFKIIHIIKHELLPLLKFAMPLTIKGIAQYSIYFFQTVFFARLGADFLAAGALVNWLIGTIVVFVYGVLSSINILVAHKFGANMKNEIANIIRDGILLLLFLTIPIFLLLWFIAPIFLLFGEPLSIVEHVTPYLHALAWGLLPNFIIIAILELIIGLGKSRVIMVIAVLSLPFNLFLNYVLIFGKYGFPRCEIAGAGWGTTINYWITAIFLIAYVLLTPKYSSYFQFKNFLKKPSYILDLLRLGLPMGLMSSFEVAFFFALSLSMGSLGSQILAANQIALQYLTLLITVVFSTAQAITVRMSHLLGARNVTLAKQTNYAGLLITLFFMMLIGIIYWYFPMILISMDFKTSNPNNATIIAISKKFLKLCALFQLLEAIRISLFGSLRALKDTQFPLIISIVSFWVIALPIGYTLANRMKLDGEGLWLGMIMGSAFSVVTLQIRFNFKIKHYH